VDFMSDIKEIKGIPVISFALIFAIVLAITMFVVGIVMVLLRYPMYTMMHYLNVTPINGFHPVFVGSIFPVYFIVVMPIMVFIFGFLVTALATIIYNFIAPKIGGIKLELK
jgi:hypothetical protein